MSKTFHITTFGCQMNEHDSEMLSGMLTKKGYEKVDNEKDANILIFNTCSIRENADLRFFGSLGAMKRRKETEGENFTICVCGCMMQQEHIVKKIKEKTPFVDVIFGTHNLHELPTLLDNLYNEKKKQISILPDRKEIVEGLPSDRLFKHKAFVNIMYGCNNFCSYCIVPYTRGREKSRHPEDIINEIKVLVNDGVVEVMLLGQNVNSYKGISKEGNEVNFAKLIRMINEIDGLQRIRFMTSHPKDLSDELIECFRDCKKLCHFFHLPVQAGSSKVLKEMNRHYDREKYLERLYKLRSVCPDMAISTDIIVGFPGETDEDFKETLSLAREVQFDSAFTFMYSRREGTPADKREDQVPENVKYERFNRLVEVINESSKDKNAQYVGKTLDVLVEGPSKRNSKAYSGRTDTFKLVSFLGRDDMIGKIVKVKITSSNTFSLEGEVIE